MSAPRKRSEAAHQSRPALESTDTKQHATPPPLGKGLVVNVDRDDAGVSALAVKLGVHADMTKCNRQHAAAGPHVAAHFHPEPVKGFAIGVMLFGGFPNEADNGWLCLATPAVPGAGDYLMDFARHLFVGVPMAMTASNGRAN
jgi:hypothetical protein